MLSLVDLAQDFSQKERPVGVLIDDEQVLNLLIAAVRTYAAYGALNSLQDKKSFTDIVADTEISTSEWGVIRPLFVLLVERETAIQLEASRGMGVETFGRSVSEISSEIAQIEAEIPHKAFYQPIVSL